MAQTADERPIPIQTTPAGQVVPLAPDATGGALPATRRSAVFGGVRRLLANRKAASGAAILLMFALVGIFAPVIAPGDPSDFVARPHQAPSSEYWFGTTGQGQVVFAQTVWGTRVSLTIGVLVGIAVAIIGVVVGMTAGYFGGRVDDVLSLVMNVFLIVPALPLLVTLAAFLPPGMLTIAFVLAFTGWPWGARVLRSQMLAMRE